MELNARYANKGFVEFSLIDGNTIIKSGLLNKKEAKQFLQQFVE